MTGTFERLASLVGRHPAKDLWTELEAHLDGVHEFEDIGESTYHTIAGSGVVIIEQGGLVKAIQLFGPGSTSEAGHYTRGLPFGPSFQFTRGQVDAILGKPGAEGVPVNSLGGPPRLEPWAKWKMPTYILHLAFSADSARVILVSILR